MHNWRNLLFLVCSFLGLSAFAQAPQIQAIPTSWMYVSRRADPLSCALLAYYKITDSSGATTLTNSVTGLVDTIFENDADSQSNNPALIGNFLETDPASILQSYQKLVVCDTNNNQNTGAWQGQADGGSGAASGHDFTVTFWHRSKGGTSFNWQYMCEGLGTDTHNNWAFNDQYGTNVAFYVRGEISPTQCGSIVSTNAGRLDDTNVWHQITAGFDHTIGLHGGLWIMVDGTNYDQKDIGVTDQFGCMHDPGSFWFINHGQGVTDPTSCSFDPSGAGGEYDEIAFYGRKLTQNEVGQLYNGGACRRPAFRSNINCLLFSNQCHFAQGPGATLFGGVVTLANALSYTKIYCTFDGSLPTNSTANTVSAIPWSPAPPAGSYLYDGPFTMPWNATIISMGSSDCGCPPSNCTNFYDSAYTTNTFFSLGQTWSNNVVANGGASPSTQSVTNFDAWGATNNNAGLITNGAILAANLMAPDSLIATLTPQIYIKGVNPWVNHNFVVGDLTVNGMAGDAVSKFVDPGFTGVNFTGDNDAGFSVYFSTTTSAAGHDTGYTDGVGTDAMFIWPNTAGTTFGFMWDATGVSVANPGPGYYSLDRVAANSLKLYFASSLSPHAQVASNAAANASRGNHPVYIWSDLITFGGQAYSANRISAVIFSRGFTSSQSSAEFNATQGCRVGLGGGFQ